MRPLEGALTSTAPQGPIDLKRTLRAALLAARGRIEPAARARDSEAIAARLEALESVHLARTVALYAPLGSEVDLLPLARRLAVRGVRTLFPRSVQGERKLRFAGCEPDDLVAGPLGAREPPAAARAVELHQIDCVVVPGVAFSLEGHRLGRGGGHYDATLPSLSRAVRIGVAFEPQVVASLPREPHDASLDALVTEARTLRFARETG